MSDLENCDCDTDVIEKACQGELAGMVHVLFQEAAAAKGEPTQLAASLDRFSAGLALLAATKKLALSKLPELPAEPVAQSSAAKSLGERLNELHQNQWPDSIRPWKDVPKHIKDGMEAIAVAWPKIINPEREQLIEKLQATIVQLMNERKRDSP